jgi:hypothetical protein
MNTTPYTLFESPYFMWQNQHEVTIDLIKLKDFKKELTAKTPPPIRFETIDASLTSLSDLFIIVENNEDLTDTEENFDLI